MSDVFIYPSLFSMIIIPIPCSNEGIRGHFHPRLHHGNVYSPAQTMPGPHPPKMPLLEAPLSTTIDTPVRYSFPSPSTESENLPRDPRQRSPKVTSPHCNNYQDRNHLMDSHTSASSNHPENCLHSMDGGELYRSFSYWGNNTANYPHGRYIHVIIMHVHCLYCSVLL